MQARLAGGLKVVYLAAKWGFPGGCPTVATIGRLICTSVNAMGPRYLAGIHNRQVAVLSRLHSIVNALWLFGTYRMWLY